MSQPALTIKPEFPEKLAPLFVPCRYKVMHGGRGGGKSWGVARALLLQGFERPLRVLCTREIQKTIADSVHKLLEDQVALLGLGGFYDVQENVIYGANGTEFIFTGLRQLNITNIKSYEGIDIVWVEEAQAVTKRSWNVLIPTIRKEDSEIWITFNPELDTDETYVRFVLNPPPDAWVQKVTYRDNPWFTEELEQERRHMQRVDPDEYDNVWEGNPRTSVVGAIYAREMSDMVRTQRIRRVPYDPALPVHTIWDLGWNDQTSIIFIQKVINEVSVIDYEEESFLRYDEWAKRLKEKPYVYGSHWLPHDGSHRTQASGGKTAQQQLTPLLRMRPRIVRQPANKEEPIRMARMLFPRVYADQVQAARLLECLKRFRRNVPEKTGEPAQPLHDEYSHGANAFGYLAMIVHRITNDIDPPVVKAEEFEPSDPGMGY